MDNSLNLRVPFPSDNPPVDEPEKTDSQTQTAVHSRVRSSPTSPIPSLLTYPKSKKKLSVTSSGSPRRTHILLTPPLTPSSSFNSTSGTESSDRDNDADSFLPSTPPPPDSPLRSAWNAAGGKFRNIGPFGNNVYLSPVSGDSDIGDQFPSRLRRIQSSSNVGSASPDGSVDITPRLEKTFSLNGSEQSLSERAIEILMTFKGVVDPTPFVLVRNIPRDTPLENLIEAFKPGRVQTKFLQSHGVVIFTFTRISDAGALKLHHGKMAKHFPGVSIQNDDGDARVEVIFLESKHVAELGETSASTALHELVVIVENGSSDSDTFRDYLSGFGAVQDFLCTESSMHRKTFRVKYTQEQEARNAYTALKSRSFFFVTLRTYHAGEDKDSAADRRAMNAAAGRNEVDLTSPPRTNADLPEDYKRRPRSVSAGDGAGGAAAVRNRQRGRDRERDQSVSPQDEFGPARMRSIGGYDRMMHPPPSPSRRRSISMGPEPEREVAPVPSAVPAGAPLFPGHGLWSGGLPDPSTLGLSTAFSFDQQTGPHPANAFAPQFAPGAPTNGGFHLGMPPPTPQLFHAAPLPQQPLMHNDGFMHHPMPPPVAQDPWFASQAPPGLQLPPANPGLFDGFGQPGSLSPVGPPSRQIPPRQSPQTPRKLFHGRGHTFDGSQGNGSPGQTMSPTSPTSLSHSASMDALTQGFASLTANPNEISQKNQLDLAAIEKGLDTRTTVMIKNIPNKMTDKDLMDFIARTSPRRIDFLYLRMDFQNGCNVGYAFVNFITVQDLLHFASTQLGVKWNMYSSEKYLQLSYANYQGKEALVEKFKNSCIMDEREAWRPKIFYSCGPNQGLPEPFPSPTHLRRKERSAHNRGALFVPGPGSHHGQHHQHQYQNNNGNGAGAGAGRGGGRNGMRERERMHVAGGHGGCEEFGRQFPPRMIAS